MAGRGVAAVSSSSNAMYHSVPPRPLSYTFSDVLRASLEQPRTPGQGSGGGSGGSGKKTRSKTAPVSAYAPEEYAERFKSRPTTRPAVIDFTGVGVKMYSGTGGSRRPVQGFPASVRSRNVSSLAVKEKSPSPKPLPQPLTERGTTATSSLHLAPLAKGAEPNSALSLQTKPCRPPPPLPVHSTTPKPSKTPELSRIRRNGRSAPSSTKSRRGKSPASSHEQQGSTKSGPVSSLRLAATADGQWGELSSSKLSTLDAMAFSVSPQDQLGLPDVLAHSEDFNDLSELPRPKRILPRRDLPWVFRFKVKKEMNALSKIMASKPTSANSVTAATGSLV